MFNWLKNKRRNKPSDLDSQTQAEKSGEVTFHTMQEDLDTIKEKDAARKWNKNEAEEKKKKVRAEIYYDENKKEGDVKKNIDRNSPFLSNIARAPEIAESIDYKTAGASTDQKPAAPRAGQGTVLKILTFLLAIAAISLGAYFFWTNNNQTEELSQTPAAPETQVPTEKTAPLEKYSSENPNYLSIDTESVSAEDISRLLIQTASEIKEFKNGGSFEFVVTDANNNPLSFSIFAYLSKINLSRNVLDSFDESFSLYFYRDDGNVRSGLAIDINNKEATALELAKEENTLVEKLQPLFLGNPFLKTGKSFNTGQYKDSQIRYINLNEDNTLSVDYSVAENQLIMGTSKNTARTIIDKIEQSENLITTSDDEDEESEEENENTDESADIEL